MSVSYYPQAYRILKGKSAQDVSLSTYIMIGIGTSWWLFYGFYTNNMTIVLGYAVGVVGSWLVVALTVYYRHIAKRTEKTSE